MIDGMMKMNRLVLAVALGLSGASWAGAAPADPEQLQTEAYVQLVQGDQSLESGRLDEAMTQYQAARRQYARLAEEFPTWTPRIIRYRATYCENQIADINRRIGEQVASRSAPDATERHDAATDDFSYIAPAVDVRSDARAQPRDEMAYQTLQRQVEDLQTQLQQAQTAQTRAEAEQARLQEELIDARRQLLQKTGAEQSAASLQQEMDLLRAQLAGFAEQDAALNEMEAELHKVRAENRSLQAQLQDMQGALDDAEIRADQAELLMRQAETRAQEAEALAAAAPTPVPTDFFPAPPPETTVAAEPEPAPVEMAAPPAMPDVIATPLPEEPIAEAEEPPPERIVATLPPRPVPRGMGAADFVRVLLQNGENETALATVQHELETHPEDTPLAVLEGITLIRLQHYAAAANLLHDLSLLHPDNAEIHANLGAAWMGDGFYPGAREALQHAIELDSDIGGEYYYNLALLYALADPIDLRRARDYYEHARHNGIDADPQLDEILK